MYRFPHGFTSAALLGGLLLACSLRSQAQNNVGIGTTTPEASAALEIRSTTQGMLLPRLTLAQRNALGTGSVAAPVTGLVIYQTDNTPGPYTYTGTTWVLLAADNLGNHTATQNLNLQGNALVGTGAALPVGVVGVGVRSDGGLNLGQNTTGNNVYLGYSAGAANTSGTGNLFVGSSSGQRNTTGLGNTFLGIGSGGNNTSGNNNTFAGLGSGGGTTTGTDNTFTGRLSGQGTTTGSANTFLGASSGDQNSSGSGNVFIGQSAGQLSQTGNNNVAVGTNSGPVVDGLTNTVALGAGVRVRQSSTLVLGTAGTRTGIGTALPNSSLQVNGTLAAVAITDINAGANNTPGVALSSLGDGLFYTLSATTNGGYYQLPDPRTCSGRLYYLRNGSGFTVTITTPSGQLLDGSNASGSGSYDLASSGSSKTVTALSDGTNWIILRSGN